MLDINFIRKNPKLVQQNAKNKGVTIDIDKILQLEKENRELITKIDQLRARLKANSKTKPGLEMMASLKKIGAEIKNLEEKQRLTTEKLNRAMLEIPAMAAPAVKVGKNESENEIIKTVGQPPKFNFKIREYLEIGENLDLIDVKRAAKVSGSRFGYLKNEAVLLELAVIQYTFDLLVRQEKFTPFFPPVMISEQAMRAMGYLEHGGEKETYHFKKDGLYLVGTSEQSIGPYHRDEIFTEEQLPRRYCAFSACFRREAGASGKDTRGILRVHQFDKIEMFVFCQPKDSDQEYQYLLSLEEKLVAGLGLPYRVVKMCTGDLGMPAAKKFDIEVWLPSQQTYRETHSTSNCVDFQARRLNIRYQEKKSGKNEFVHTLNGTAFAIGRILIMILENYQQRDGSVEVPSVLQKYCGFKEIKR